MAFNHCYLLNSAFRIFAPRAYGAARKMSSEAMNRKASSSVSTVSPNGPEFAIVPSRAASRASRPDHLVPLAAAVRPVHQSRHDKGCSLSSGTRSRAGPWQAYRRPGAAGIGLADEPGTLGCAGRGAAVPTLCNRAAAARWCGGDLLVTCVGNRTSVVSMIART